MQLLEHCINSVITGVSRNESEESMVKQSQCRILSNQFFYMRKSYLGCISPCKSSFSSKLSTKMFHNRGITGNELGIPNNEAQERP